MIYLFKVIGFVALTVGAAVVTILAGPFDPYGNRVYGIGRFWARSVLRLGGVTLKVRGLDQVDPGRQYVFMANHQSNLDIPILVQSLRGFQLRWIAKRELLRVPFFGWALWAAKHIIVDRADRAGALETFNQARKRMAGGISLVVFPEGTRSSDGRLLPFKKGGFLLASRTRTAVVPITIRNSGAALPRGEWRIRPESTVEVVIHAPVATAASAAGRLKSLAEQVRETIGRDLPSADEAAPRSATQRVSGPS